MDPEVLVEETDVVGRLHGMGMAVQVLRDAVREGVAPVIGCTGHDPAQLPGILGWGKITRALRDRMVPSGWKARGVRGQALTTSADGSVSVVVAAGDENTGRLGDSPTTRSAKGPATKDAVAWNQRSFAEISADFAKAAPDRSTARTWALLYFIDEEEDEVRVELSLPTHIRENGFVAEWHERIILPAVELSTPPSAPHDELEDEHEETVPVHRRSAG